MQISRFIVNAFMIASLCAHLGCSGTSPFSMQPMDAFSTNGGFDNPNRQPYDQLAEAFPQHNVIGPSGSQMPVQPQQPSNQSGWLASLRSGGDAITNAFSFQPQTIPANDPTGLTGSPKNAGGALNYRAAKVYETQGNVAGAMALYQKTLQMSPNDTRAAVSYARLLDREGNFREAEHQYQRVLEIDPKNVVALNDMGMIYARQGMFDQSLAALGKAVELDPTNQRYRNNIAIVLIDADRADDAHQQLSQVHGPATAHYNVGYLLARRNKNDQAAWHLQQALAMNPRLAPATQLLDTLSESTGYAQQAIPHGSQQQVGYPGQGNYLPASNRTPVTNPLPPL